MQKERSRRSRSRLGGLKISSSSVHVLSEDNGARTSESITPLDFDNFIPWVCREWGVPHRVIVVRTYKEEEVKSTKLEKKRSSIKHSQSRVVEDFRQQILKQFKEMSISETLDFHNPSTVLKKELKTFVIIEATYNIENQLEAISIVGCPIDIPRKVIRGISICLPFHSTLNRLSIKKGGLSSNVLYEIAKLLPYSNITVVCLDDSIVTKGNYSILLQETSQLNYLSMNRCKINDDACKDIAMNLSLEKPGANFLKILEMSSNNITDTGAQFLGNMLRSNRCLLHLNVADNNITDDGAKVLIKPMMEFRLTSDEVLDMKRRRYKYLQKKEEIVNKSLKQILGLEEKESNNHSNSTYPFSCSSYSVNSSLKKTAKERKSSQPVVPKFDQRAYAEKMADDIVGEFIDPYSPMNVELKDGHYYANGNLILCSLNVAYNSLRFPSLKIIDEVLTYQHRMNKSPPATGLMRIVLEGNYFQECNELNRIMFYLKLCTYRRLPVHLVSERIRKSSTMSKKSHRTISFLKN